VHLLISTVYCNPANFVPLATAKRRDWPGGEVTKNEEKYCRRLGPQREGFLTATQPFIFSSFPAIYGVGIREACMVRGRFRVHQSMTPEIRSHARWNVVRAYFLHVANEDRPFHVTDERKVNADA
jgi:hypothetical protein